ncbi:MAG: hypothetical protein K940chlam6_01162 [Chlamydiae bacterium]|nr:hypothetical protein [Chlamydiota bacterium]
MTSTYQAVYRYDNYQHRAIGRMESVPTLTPTYNWMPSTYTYDSTSNCFDCNVWKGVCSDTCSGCIKLIASLVIPTAICTGQFALVTHNIHSEAIVMTTNILAVALITTYTGSTCYFYWGRGKKNPKGIEGTLIPTFASLGFVVSSAVFLSSL